MMWNQYAVIQSSSTAADDIFGFSYFVFAQTKNELTFHVNRLHTIANDSLEKPGLRK